MFDVLEISKYVIKYEDSKGRPISNLRLQKLLYFIQANSLVETSKPCFKQKIEAWDYGPVVPSAYHEYKKFGSTPIFPSKRNIDILDSKTKVLINEILEECSKITTKKLVEITHRQKPWKIAYANYYNKEITTQSILEYFGDQDGN